jgi:recombinational DNA repair protein RecT
MTPSTVQINYLEIKSEMDKATLPQLVNSPYVTSQLKPEMIETFKSNFMVLISDPKIAEALKKADRFSIMTSLLNLTKDGLSINPYDKEAAIVDYGGRAVAVPMAKGKIKKMQANGIINRIQYLEIVYQGDVCTNKNGIWEHSINIARSDDAKMLGVLLIVLMPDRTYKSKFVMAKEVNKRKAKSKMPGIWKDWEEEMWKKTAVNMFEKEIGGKAQFDYKYEGDEDSEDETTDTNHEVVEQEPLIQDPILVDTLNQLIESEIEDEKIREILKGKMASMDDVQLQSSIEKMNEAKAKKEAAKTEEAPEENEPPI